MDGLADAGHLTSSTARERAAPAESRLVVGGDAVSPEQTQSFARLGTRVAVVGAPDRLAPSEEPEVTATVRAVFVIDPEQTVRAVRLPPPVPVTGRATVPARRMSAYGRHSAATCSAVCGTRGSGNTRTGDCWGPG